MIVSAPANDPVLVMTRTFDAPRALVWAALTDPKQVAVWFGGHGFSNPVVEMDVRDGGRWHHVMRTPDGVDHTMDYVFVEVKAPERLVWCHANFGVGGPHDNHMTVTLEDLGDKTKWTLVARFVSEADRVLAQQMHFAEVLGQGCDKLNGIVRH
jgi:uncharacterized protein YndB with AHSA1/START domain